MATETPPKLFVSYSWSNADHEAWVLDLAKSLVESGIEVLLDKWQLRDGHDSIKYMESMVTNEDVKKVLILADRVYVERANTRVGGVGTETQILTPDGSNSFKPLHHVRKLRHHANQQRRLRVGFGTDMGLALPCLL